MGRTKKVVIPTGGLPVRESITSSSSKKKSKKKKKVASDAAPYDEAVDRRNAGAATDTLPVMDASAFVNQKRNESFESTETTDDDEEDEDGLVSSTFRVMLVGACLLGTGTLAFHQIPGLLPHNQENGDDGEDVDRWINAFYCATMTLTT